MSNSKPKTKSNNTNQIIVLLIVAVLIGWVVGYLLGANAAANDDAAHDEVEASQTADNMQTDDMEAHSHSETVEASASKPPTVKLNVTKDAKAGYNIEIVTTNFEFTPKNANGENIDGQGHAHIYLNGEKINRVYSNWYYLGDVPEGENEIKVSLNANDHAEYVIDGEPIETVVVVDNDGHSDHTHAE